MTDRTLDRASGQQLSDLPTGAYEELILSDSRRILGALQFARPDLEVCLPPLDQKLLLERSPFVVSARRRAGFHLVS
jgi:hypothetical protein